MPETSPPKDADPNDAAHDQYADVAGGRRRPMIPEYDRAAEVVFDQTVQMLMAAEESLLQHIPATPVDHLPAEPAPPGTSTGTHGRRLVVEIPASLSRSAVLACDLDVWTTVTWETAQTGLQRMMPELYQSLGEILDSAGRSVDARGKPMSRDLILDVLEGMELDFDDEGHVKNLVFVAHPSLVEQVSRLPPPTAEQIEREKAIMARKRAEFDARRRVRRLDK